MHIVGHGDLTTSEEEHFSASSKHHDPASMSISSTCANLLTRDDEDELVLDTDRHELCLSSRRSANIPADDTKDLLESVPGCSDRLTGTSHEDGDSESILKCKLW